MRTLFFSDFTTGCPLQLADILSVATARGKITCTIVQPIEKIQKNYVGYVFAPETA